MTWQDIAGYLPIYVAACLSGAAAYKAIAASDKAEAAESRAADMASVAGRHALELQKNHELRASISSDTCVDADGCLVVTVNVRGSITSTTRSVIPRHESLNFAESIVSRQARTRAVS